MNTHLPGRFSGKGKTPPPEFSTHRYLAVHLPKWPVDRVMRHLHRRHMTSRRGRPFMLLVGTQQGKRVVMACCHRAATLGVRTNMTLAHATALLPTGEVMVTEHQPVNDLAALYALARWAIRFSPSVAPDPPDGLLIDATGCRRLYGGDEAMASLVVNSIRQLHFEVRAAIAPTVGSAWALARFTTTVERSWLVADENELHKILLPLPAASLRVGPAVAAELAEVGIDSVDQLLDIPRDEIASRFGEEVLLRIDQALGGAMEILNPLRPRSLPEVSIRFAGPATQIEAIERTIRSLLDELSAKLLAHEAGMRRLVLAVERLGEDLRPQFIQESITFSRPSRDAKHLWTMLRPHVERLHLGYGIEQITLMARQISTLSHEQHRFAEEAEHSDSAAVRKSAGQLIDLLQSRLGVNAVLQCESHDTHIPEAAFRFRAASESGLFNPTPTPIGTPEGDRPTVLLERPEPVRVALLQPEGPVINVQWRNLHRVVTAIGPERISRRWWHFGLSSHQAHRDYYKLQDEQGLWLWVYRNRMTGRWFVHGLWA